MIPPSLTHAEVGYLLEAIGQQMYKHDLCFAAAWEDGHSTGEILEALTSKLQAEGQLDPCDRAAHLLSITGEEMIWYVDIP